MSAAKSSSSDTPVYKVGGIILRGLDTENPQVLITQPRPKPETPNDIPSMGLPRGTRQYWERKGLLGKQWHDARDAETARKNADRLEPLTSTLQKEMYQEAGLPPEVLRQQPVYDFGAKEFTSATKDPYMVQWYVITPSDAAQKEMAKPSDDPEKLKDAVKTEWVSVDELKRRTTLTRGEQDYVNPTYVPIVQEAIAKMRDPQFVASQRVKSIPRLPESASKA